MGGTRLHFACLAIFSDIRAVRVTLLADRATFPSAPSPFKTKQNAACPLEQQTVRRGRHFVDSKTSFFATFLSQPLASGGANVHGGWHRSVYYEFPCSSSFGSSCSATTTKPVLLYFASSPKKLLAVPCLLARVVLKMRLLTNLT